MVAVRGEAQFLAVLVLARGDVLRQLDGDAGIVAVVLRVPVPETPRGDRGERRPAEVQVADRVDPALVGVDVERPIDVGLAIVRVGAGGRVAELRGKSEGAAELAARGALRLADAQEHLRAAIGLEVGEVGDQPHAQPVVGLEEQLPAHRLGAERVGVAARADVLQHPVAARRDARDAVGDGVAQRPRRPALGLDEVVLAVRQLGEPLLREGRRTAGDVDRARGRVLAEQRPLRPAQLLDLLDVGEVEGGGGGAGVVDLVDVEADPRFQPVVRLADRDHRRSQAADRERRVARVGGGIVEAGDQRRQPLRVHGVALVEQVAADHRQRSRHRLRVLRAAARGDDHLGHDRRPVVLRRGLALRRRRRTGLPSRRARRRPGEDRGRRGEQRGGEKTDHARPRFADAASLLCSSVYGFCISSDTAVQYLEGVRGDRPYERARVISGRAASRPGGCNATGRRGRARRR